MPKINPNKSYAPALNFINPEEDNTNIPDNWLDELKNLIPDILALNQTEKEIFQSHFDKHVGSHSTYLLKTHLQESLKLIYQRLINPIINADQKSAIAANIAEDISTCSNGVHDRINDLLINFSIPADFNALLAIIRQEIVKQFATQETNEVHAHNRILLIALVIGFSVRPLNVHDKHTGNVSDELITAKLQQLFAKKYTVFAILNSLQFQIEKQVKIKGYIGEKDTPYLYEDYQKFDSDFLKRFIEISNEELFFTENKNGNPEIYDINWQNIKITLLKKIRDENYFSFSDEENNLINILTTEQFSKDYLEAITLSAVQQLLPTVEELTECLIFFKTCNYKVKDNLISCYLSSHFHTIEDLNLLEKTLETYDLSQLPETKKTFLMIAVEKGNLDDAKNWINRGADINSALAHIFANHKNEALQWLEKEPELLARITQEGINTRITKGFNRDKSVFQIFIESKKGYQLLIKNPHLQNLHNKILGEKSRQLHVKKMQDWIKGKFEELIVSNHSLCIENQMLFFTYISPELKKLLQHVAYGEQEKVFVMLEKNPSLLLEKGMTQDYSGRKFYRKTALQLALGAEDIRFHENEKCMVEIIEYFFSKLPNGEEAMFAQIEKQFPEDWEDIEKERIREDLIALQSVSHAVRIATKHANCDEVLYHFKAYLHGKCLSAAKNGMHFNMQLLITALNLYCEQYMDFGGDESFKNNLFWKNVIGTILRYIPAHYAQAIAQRIFLITHQGEYLKRSLEYPDGGKQNFFYPMDKDPLFRMGYEQAFGVPSAYPPEVALVSEALTLLSQTKRARLEKFISSPSLAEQFLKCYQVNF